MKTLETRQQWKRLKQRESRGRKAGFPEFVRFSKRLSWKTMGNGSGAVMASAGSRGRA